MCSFNSAPGVRYVLKLYGNAGVHIRIRFCDIGRIGDVCIAKIAPICVNC